MTPDRKELFRKAILRVLNVNRSRYGLGIVAIGHHTGTFGFSADSFTTTREFYDGIADELQYLQDKKFVEEVDRGMSKENRSWRLSTAGIAFVDVNNLSE